MKDESFTELWKHKSTDCISLHAIVSSSGILPSLQLNKDPERAKPSVFYIRFSLSGINPGINVVLMFSSGSASTAVNETASPDFNGSWGRSS